MGKTSDTQCPFCEELAKMKDTIEYHQQVRPDDTKYKFTVALVQEMFLDEDWRTGKSTHYGFELNVCPVCGTKIVKENKNGYYVWN